MKYLSLFIGWSIASCWMKDAPAVFAHFGRRGRESGKGLWVWGLDGRDFWWGGGVGMLSVREHVFWGWGLGDYTLDS